MLSEQVKNQLYLGYRAHRSNIVLSALTFCHYHGFGVERNGTKAIKFWTLLSKKLGNIILVLDSYARIVQQDYTALGCRYFNSFRVIMTRLEVYPDFHAE